MTLSNKLTFFRILAIPPTLVLIMLYNANLFILGYLIAIFIGFTDFLDGYLARKHNEITNLGKFMDPLADKMFVGTMALVLVYFRFIPIWLLVVILVRELLVTNLRIFGIYKKTEIEVSPLGKMKAFSHFFLLMFMGFLRWTELSGVYSRPFPNIIQHGMYSFIGIVAILTILSSIDYIWRNKHLLSDL